MDEIEIPQYFICPISLQIMKDPVTVITGITYDRESIEQWLFSCKNTTCPVTKHPLPLDSELTPNHTLRRLIQAWCSDNASKGVDRIPTPKQPLERTQVFKLLKDLKNSQLQLKTLRQLEFLAAEDERNRECLSEAGVAKALLSFIVGCYDKGQLCGLEEAFSVLLIIPIPSSEIKTLPRNEIDQIIDSLTWSLGALMDSQVATNAQVMIILKRIVEAGNSQVLEILKENFFKKITGFLRHGVTQSGLNAVLHVMLEACTLARHRTLMVEAGAIFELIEIELGTPEKRIAELAMAILSNLCRCAEGRAEFLSHAGGLAVVAKRIMSVSAAVDDSALMILSMICKYSGNSAVYKEMLRTGVASKLCMLLQADTAPYLKERAIDILRWSSDEWSGSPCLNPSILTMYTRRNCT